jgi:hypothetical protein
LAGYSLRIKDKGIMKKIYGRDMPKGRNVLLKCYQKENIGKI